MHPLTHEVVKLRSFRHLNAFATHRTLKEVSHPFVFSNVLTKKTFWLLQAGHTIALKTVYRIYNLMDGKYPKQKIVEVDPLSDEQKVRHSMTAVREKRHELT